MHSRLVTAALVAAVLVMPARRLAAADDATLLRVFLNDGTSLVSYGEPARVGDRVVFSMPTGTGPSPPLQFAKEPGRAQRGACRRDGGAWANRT